jgi:hypothetical protein
MDVLERLMQREVFEQKMSIISWAQWLTPVIPATWEVEIRKIMA